MYPNEKTLPWIRECIIGYKDYSKWEYHYEIQLMIRKASEHFGTRLLSKAELTAIFDDIISGPSKEEFRKWMGEQYNDDAFQQRQRHFHRMQLRPFAALLSGEYRRNFDELEHEKQDEVISDDSYSPYKLGSGGYVTDQSPKSAESLEKLTDDDLLAYLNDWDDEHHDKENWLVEINISALAVEFQSLFKNKIIPVKDRLTFWMVHRNKIARPIYVAAMTKAMQELVKEKNFDNLDKWIEFYVWILSHPDSERVEGKPESQDESRDAPDWGSSRRAVVDFIDACLSKDADAPITAREGFANLLQDVCTQFDWRLDRDRPVLLSRDDQVTEAINNTRSRALESLINFGFWVRRHLPGDSVPEVTDILTKRMAEGAEIPLTRPEHALLALHYVDLCVLNLDWASKHRRMLFPQNIMSIWSDSFKSFIKFNRPKKPMFDILREEYEFALQHLDILDASKERGNELVSTLGQHLFLYYLWEAYPLTGNTSLLDCFYEKTENNHQHWARLFDHIGRTLRNSGNQIESVLVDRATAFFDWRFNASDPLELQEFTFWLDADCLDPEWRLNSYSKILELGHRTNSGVSLEVATLNKLLSAYLPLVVECFAKITDTFNQGNHLYILADEAKPILKAGLNAEDSQVRENAERARENILRIGRFDFLDIK